MLISQAKSVRNRLFAAVAAATLVVGPAAQAATWITSGSTADGNVAAQAVITSSANSLNIQLTNTFANPTSPGQMLSGIEILLGTAPGSDVLAGTPTGTLINLNGGVATPDNVDTIDHWGTGISGGWIFLETAGAFAVGGQPRDMIIDGGGVYTNNNNGVKNFDPYIKGTGTFVLTLTGEPNPNVTGVKFLFGTSPDYTLTGTCSAGCTPGIPEPASWTLMIVGFGGLGVALRRRRHRFATA